MNNFLQISYFKKIKGKTMRLYLGDGTLEIGEIMEYDDTMILIKSIDNNCEIGIFRNYVVKIKPYYERT